MHNRIADGTLALGVGLSGYSWLAQLNVILDALVAIAAITASVAAAIYYFKGGKD